MPTSHPPLPPTFEALYRQLSQLPEPLRGEILDGSLIVSPRPGVPHARAGAEIEAEIYSRFGRKPGGSGFPGGWWILPEPELHFLFPDQTHVLAPDLAGWKRERLPSLPRSSFLTLPPDWVCEILSPSTARYDRKGKARVYHRAGVTWRWLVDPNIREIEAFRREGDFWVQLGVWGDEEKVRIAPFDAIELDLADWWEGVDREEE